MNPDFGQVEVDPAVINLTAFETFFEERRPFFVEGARIFDFSLSGGPNRLLTAKGNRSGIAYYRVAAIVTRARSATTGKATPVRLAQPASCDRS